MSTSDLTATDNEVYVALADTTQAFPATVENKRWNGYAVPRFRRTIAETVAEWLNAMHDDDPGEWHYTVTFDGDALTVLDTDEGTPDRIEPDASGRYAIGYRGWCWELAAPPSDPETDAALLADSARLVPEDNEILVTINIDGTDPVFPALASATHGWSRAGCPRFRRTVAEAVVAWISHTASKYPEGSDSAYWDGDTIVLIDNQAIGADGYLPARITANDDGRYSIGATFEWERAD